MHRSIEAVERVEKLGHAADRGLVPPNLSWDAVCVHEIQASICCAAAVEKVHDEDAGSCHFPSVATLIPSPGQNVVDFVDVEPSYVVVAEVSATLVLGPLPDPRHRHRRRHLSCP